MPRERIQRPRFNEVVTVPGQGELRESDAPLLHIVWSPSADPVNGSNNGWVQVMLECDREWLDNVLAEKAEQDNGKVTLYSECLTREEMNSAIRTLRRARDRVHGADA
jgi:hypothetical protein